MTKESSYGTKGFSLSGQSRRELLVGGLVCVCGATIPNRASGQTPPHVGLRANPRRMICGSSPDNPTETFQIEERRILRLSGFSELDKNIGIELSALDTIFANDAMRPEFAFYSDNDAPIGARTVRNQSNKSRVILGVHLIGEEQRTNPSFWVSSIIGTLAHEWGHAKQFASNYADPTFYWETHADYMAGWYLGVKFGRGVAVNREAFAHYLFVKGVQGQRNSFNPNLYGSPQDRVTSMQTGFDLGLLQVRTNEIDVNSALQAGYIFVRGMSR